MSRPHHGSPGPAPEAPPPRGHASASLDRVALQATLHCLTGCSIGEILGMVLGSALRWPNAWTVVASVVLAFVFGYALTVRPLLASGIRPGRALRLAFASDTVSIAVMEVVDNLFMLAVPGAMDAPIASALFWISLVASLVLAGLIAFPVNRWLIARGGGHAATHSHDRPPVHPHHGGER